MTLMTWRSGIAMECISIAAWTVVALLPWMGLAQGQPAPTICEQRGPCGDDCAPYATLGCILPSPSMDVVKYEVQFLPPTRTTWGESHFAMGRVQATVPLDAITDLGWVRVRIRAVDGAGNVSPWLITQYRNTFNLALLQAVASPGESLVTDVTVHGAIAYAGFAVGRLRVGELAYTDRQYTITQVPAGWSEQWFIQTANKAKAAMGPDPFLSFTVHRTAEVCVAYDVRIQAVPDWLQGWTSQQSAVITNDAMLSLWCRTVLAGPVSVGPNAGGGRSSQYLVLVRPG